MDATGFRTSDPELIARARSRDVLSKAQIQPDGTIFQLRWVVTNGKEYSLAILNARRVIRDLWPMAPACLAPRKTVTS